MPHPRILRVSFACALLGAVLAIVPAPSFAAPRAMVVDSAPVTVARQEPSAPFAMIGLSWDGHPEAHAQVRARTATGWGEWLDLSGEPDDGPDRASHEFHRGRAVTAPVWVGEADGYEVRLPRGVTGARVHLVREGGRHLRISASAPRASGLGARPSIVGRAGWGARPPRVSPSFAGTVKMAFVHHTVNSNSYARSQVPAMLRAIQAYHMDANGWDDIGYNFLVDRFGGIWEGRDGGIDQAVIGAHAGGFNTYSTGVAMIGDFTSTVPSSASVLAVARLIGWKLPLTAADPLGTATMVSFGSDKYPEGAAVRMSAVSGHRDAKLTSCPGAQLYARLPVVRLVAGAIAGGSALAFPGFRGGLFVATGQLDGTGPSETIVGADAGGGPHFRTFGERAVPRVWSFAFPDGFRGGVRVAAGRLLEGPTDQIVVGAGPGGGPHVRAMTEGGTQLASFYAYPSAFHGGVYVAAGTGRIVTGAGAGGGPHVRVFRADGVPLGDGFYAYSPAFHGGARVATADVDGDGTDEIVTGAGPGGGPHVRVFRQDGTPVGPGFFAYDPRFTGGVYVGKVRSPDGRSDLIVTGAGEGGGADVRVYDVAGNLRNQFLGPFSARGVRVAGGSTGSAPTLALTGGPGSMATADVTDLGGSPVLVI